MVRLLLVLLLFCLVRPAAAADWLAPGPWQVKVLDQLWRDPGRDVPVVLFSHGLGGSREAGHGYLSLHLQHPGSDETLWRGQGSATARRAMVQAMDGRQLAARVADVRFALQEAARRKAAGQAPWAAATLAFWDAHLRGQPEAAQWLEQELPKLLEPEDELEMK